MTDKTDRTDKTEVWQQWLVDQDRWNGDYAYRGIYAAYGLALRPSVRDDHEASMSLAEDGAFLLSTNGHRPPLRLADVAEATEFAEWLKQRCCGDRHPDMAAWEDQQHEWFKEDLGNWTSG